MHMLLEQDLSKQIYGEKVFDLAALQPEEEGQIKRLEIPKDVKKRMKFEQQMLMHDTNLNAKVTKLKNQMRASAEVPE